MRKLKYHLIGFGMLAMLAFIVGMILNIHSEKHNGLTASDTAAIGRRKAVNKANDIKGKSKYIKLMDFDV